MNDSPLPHSNDLAIIGAGPQALTLVTKLIKKCPKLRNRFLVFDPSGTWLTQWREQFAALEIPHLRSPAVHHPDPNPFALRKFAESRPHELFDPYGLPGTQLFSDFCDHVTKDWQLENRVYTAKVKQILPITRRCRRYFQLGLEDGKVILARRVVVATGGGRPLIPDWVAQIPSSYPTNRLCHSQGVDLRKLQLQGENILVIGGGLTSGHLGVGAIARGATVTLMARRKWQEKLFDAEPGWLGPKYLKGFWAETDWETRSRIIRKARNGGSLTPAIMLRLRRSAREGKAILNDHCEVIKAEWQENHWQVHCSNGKVLKYDRIWLATGTQLDVANHPLLTDVLKTHPTEIVRGLPVLDHHLRIPGCECFLMGGLAALQIGPVARNLSGGRMASERIVPALSKPSQGLFQRKIA